MEIVKINNRNYTKARLQVGRYTNLYIGKEIVASTNSDRGLPTVETDVRTKSVFVEVKYNRDVNQLSSEEFNRLREIYSKDNNLESFEVFLSKTKHAPISVKIENSAVTSIIPIEESNVKTAKEFLAECSTKGMSMEETMIAFAKYHFTLKKMDRLTKAIV